MFYECPGCGASWWDGKDDPDHVFPYPKKLCDKCRYPNAKKENWPDKAKLSKGETEFMDGVFGAITSDGLRGYICTVCGKTVTEAHHVKPEKYTIIYMGQEFYAERHVCDPCMQDHKRRKGAGSEE